MPTYSINILVRWIQRGEAVTQSANQRIQRLIRYPRGLLISPYSRNQIGTADNLTMTFIQQPKQFELLCRKWRNKLLLVHPNPARFLIHHQTAWLTSTFKQGHGGI